MHSKWKPRQSAPPSVQRRLNAATIDDAEASQYRSSLVDGDVPQRPQHVRPLRVVRHHGLVQHVGVRQQDARVAPQGRPFGLWRVAVVGGDARTEECGSAWGEGWG